MSSDGARLIPGAICLRGGFHHYPGLSDPDGVLDHPVAARALQRGHAICIPECRALRRERFAVRGDHEEVWGACDVVKPGAVSASSPDVTFAFVRLRKSAQFTYEYDMNILWRPVYRFVKRRLHETQHLGLA